MSMQPAPVPEPDPAVAEAVRAAFPGKRRRPLAVTVRDNLGVWLEDEAFAAAFGARGRPGESPAVLALVTVLQYAENLTDREAVMQLAVRNDWKYLLGLPGGAPAFDHTVLSEFRGRAAKHGLDKAVLDALVARLVQDGLLKPGGRQRTDSTHVLAAVRELHVFELVAESVRAALEALAVACPRWLAARFCVSDWTARYGARTGSWSAPRSRKEQDELAVAHARDGYALTAACYEDSAPPFARDLDAVQVLRTVLIQNFCATRDESGREVISRREPGTAGIPPAHLRIESPYDTDARRGAKADLTWLGYKLHVTDTCEGPPACGCPPHARCRHDVLPNLITDAATTDATVPDVKMAVPIAGALHARNVPPGRQYADSGYASAENMRALARLGITLVTPLLADNSRQAREKKGYDRTAFTIDYGTRTVTCPQGQHNSRWKETTDRGKPVIQVAFPPPACRTCPARPDCTTASPRHGRGLTLPPRDIYELQAAARAGQDSKEWREDYKRRAGCEATISQAVTVTGARRARYRGLEKTRLEHACMAAALNLYRLDAYWNDTPIDRTRTSHLARLDMNPRLAA
jgi:transposase/IS5 family transposase